MSTIDDAEDDFELALKLSMEQFQSFDIPMEDQQQNEEDLMLAFKLQTEGVEEDQFQSSQSSSIGLVYDSVDPEPYEDPIVDVKYAFTPLFGSAKNSNVTGTFESKVFQIEFVGNQDDQDSLTLSKGEDPTSVRLLNMLGCHCVPHVGVYSEE